MMNVSISVAPSVAGPKLLPVELDDLFLAKVLAQRLKQFGNTDFLDNKMTNPRLRHRVHFVAHHGWWDQWIRTLTL